MPEEGWYPDPSDNTRYRYWDGQQWTEHTLPVVEEPEPALEPEPAPDETTSVPVPPPSAPTVSSPEAASPSRGSQYTQRLAGLALGWAGICTGWYVIDLISGNPNHNFSIFIFTLMGLVGGIIALIMSRITHTPPLVPIIVIAITIIILPLSIITLRGKIDARAIAHTQFEAVDAALISWMANHDGTIPAPTESLPVNITLADGDKIVLCYLPDPSIPGQYRAVPVGLFSGQVYAWKHDTRQAIDGEMETETLPPCSTFDPTAIDGPSITTN